MNNVRTFEIAHFGLGFERTRGKQCIAPGRREPIGEETLFGLVRKTKSLSFM